MLADFGCDLEQTYFDVPRMRSSTSSGYLTTGIAYAWHPHRDTWYSAPPCQINWWLPIYELASENAMAFHPRYCTEGVANSSAGYNYYTWNKLHRGESVAELTKEDPRPLPRPTEAIEIDPQIRLVCRSAGCSSSPAAQMHSSVPNTSGVTRFSIDFRTVHLDDVVGRKGAPNVDSPAPARRCATTFASRTSRDSGRGRAPLRRRHRRAGRTDLHAEERVEYCHLSKPSSPSCRLLLFWFFDSAPHEQTRREASTVGSG